jgi:hypothetical protein
MLIKGRNQLREFYIIESVSYKFLRDISMIFRYLVSVPNLNLDFSSFSFLFISSTISKSYLSYRDIVKGIYADISPKCWIGPGDS